MDKKVVLMAFVSVSLLLAMLPMTKSTTVTVVANKNYLFEKIFMKDLFAIANSVDEIEQIYIVGWIALLIDVCKIRLVYIPGLSDYQKVDLQYYVQYQLEPKWYVKYVEPNYFFSIDGPPPWPGFAIGELIVGFNGVSKEYDANELYYPTAFFTYSPHFPCVNGTVTLNAAPSLSGWNGTHDMPIVSYAWNFGDGTPVITEADPVIIYNYTAEGTYIITLNITDSQGLWNTTSKPIIVLRAHPTAKFTYLPPFPGVNLPLTFDASSSEPGWNGTHFMPIVSYSWDFGDGNITTTSNATITHEYAVNTTYTVTLNITDSQGLWNTTSKIITIGLPFHDVAIMDVTAFSPIHGPPGNPYVVTECYSTWMVDIIVTINNNGTYPESFTVEAFYGDAGGNYTLGTQTVTDLSPGANTTLIFIWDVPGIPKAYPYPVYTISAEASVVDGDVDTTDNIMVNGTVKVKWLGDANGDGYIGLVDLMILAPRYRLYNIPGVPYYDPRADFSGDGTIGLPDLMILAMNYKKGPLG